MISSRDIEAARTGLVDELVRLRAIRTPAVERAFRRVARHSFLPSPFVLPIDPLLSEFQETDDPRRIYTDTVVMVNPERTITCAPPSRTAEQIEQLAAADGMRVLHIGTGCGYYTAILAEVVGERGTVVGIEYDEHLAERSTQCLAQAGYTTVTIRAGDGAFGVPEASPFDRILISAGAADIPPTWISQLDDDGRLVLPLCQVGPLGMRLSGGALLTVHKQGRALWGEICGATLCTPLRGALAPEPEESQTVADGLQRWFALEEFLRSGPTIRIAMKPSLRLPDPDSVPWFLETRSATMWIEPS